VLERALEVGGSCALHPIVELLREVVAQEPSASPAGQLVGRVKAAIGALAAGDFRRAIHLLDCWLLWPSEVVTGHALLAQAWLETEAATPRDLFRKRRALARLLGLLGEPVRIRHDLPPLPGGPDDQAIAAIADRARAFLLG
jgi:hypothetical protein